MNESEMSSIPCAQPSGCGSPPKNTSQAIPTYMSSGSLFADSNRATAESSTSTADTQRSNQFGQSAKRLRTWPKMANSATTVPSPPGGLNAHMEKLSLWPHQQMNQNIYERALKLESRFSTQNGSENWRSVPTKRLSPTSTNHCCNIYVIHDCMNCSCRKTSVPYSSGQRDAANRYGPSGVHRSQHSGSRTWMS